MNAPFRRKFLGAMRDRCEVWVRDACIAVLERVPDPGGTHPVWVNREILLAGIGGKRILWPFRSAQQAAQRSYIRWQLSQPEGGRR